MLALMAVAGCGEQEGDTALLPALGLTAPAYVPGAARVEARFAVPGARAGAAEAAFDDQPQSCRGRRQGAALSFALSVGPQRTHGSRSSDSIRVWSGAIGRRPGKEGDEARVTRQAIDVGGAGPLAVGAGGRMRLVPDLRSGTVELGGEDDRVTITFRC